MVTGSPTASRLPHTMPLVAVAALCDRTRDALLRQALLIAFSPPPPATPCVIDCRELQLLIAAGSVGLAITIASAALVAVTAAASDWQSFEWLLVQSVRCMQPRGGGTVVASGNALTVQVPAVLASPTDNAASNTVLG